MLFFFFGHRKRRIIVTLFQKKKKKKKNQGSIGAAWKGRKAPRNSIKVEEGKVPAWTAKAMVPFPIPGGKWFEPYQQA